MTLVIDTSSLLSLVRYYLPFDKNSILFNFVKSKIEKGEIIVIDKVLEQCKYMAGGIVLKKLTYLADDKFLKTFKVPYNTDNILPPSPKTFFNLLENQFLNKVVRKQKQITDEEFEIEKEKFLTDADAKQIILCLHLKNKNDTVVLISEETESSNDNKLFKKIPAICKEISILHSSLPEIINNLEGIDINFV